LVQGGVSVFIGITGVAGVPFVHFVH